MKIDKVLRAFEKNGYDAVFFDRGVDAAEYLDSCIDDTTVAFGDSETLLGIGLYDRLVKHNVVHDPMHGEFFSEAREGMKDDIFITSVNGATQDGILVNLDGTGNRVAGTLFGHRKVYLVFGVNKIEEDLEKAIWRVRNIAAPRNAMRHGYDTACTRHGGDRCYDCNCDDRICNGLLIHYKKMRNEDMEVVIIGEDLGL